jgi:hypothetical protein
MDLPGQAQALLDAAKAALPSVDRAFLAGGPGVALVCRMLVVYPAPITVRNAGGELGCAVQVLPQLMLVYAKDCYPPATVEVGELKIPDPAKVSAWTAEYLTEVEALYDGLTDLVVEGGCDSVTLSPANFAGPFTGVCSVRIPVTFAPA